MILRDALLVDGRGRIDDEAVIHFDADGEGDDGDNSSGGERTNEITAVGDAEPHGRSYAGP